MQQQEDFRLTEEEFLIINKNEKIANKLIIQNEQIFKKLLNEYLKKQRNEQYTKPQMYQMTVAVSITQFCIHLQPNTVNNWKSIIKKCVKKWLSTCSADRKIRNICAISR